MNMSYKPKTTDAVASGTARIAIQGVPLFVADACGMADLSYLLPIRLW
jgi:hypothetical protein